MSNHTRNHYTRQGDEPPTRSQHLESARLGIPVTCLFYYSGIQGVEGEPSKRRHESGSVGGRVRGVPWQETVGPVNLRQPAVSLVIGT